MSEKTNSDQPMPASMGVDEALDFITSSDGDENQGNTDYDGVANREEEEEDSVDPDKEVESEEETDEEEVSDEEDEESDEEEEADDSEDEDEDEDDEDDAVFSFIDGEEEVKVNAEEAKAGYMRNRDYSNKSKQLAEDRKALEAEKSSLLETKAKYVEALGAAKAAASEQLKDFIGVDWQQLQKDDPIEFEERKQAFEAAKLAFESTAQAQEQEQNALTQEYMGHLQELKKQEWGKLEPFLEPSLVGEENDPLGKIRDFAVQTYGFTPEEMMSIYDHRMIRVVMDAFKGAQSTDRVDKGKKKIKSMKQKATKSKSTSKARQAKAVKAKLNQPGGVTIDEALQALMGR